MFIITFLVNIWHTHAVADLRGAQGSRPPPTGDQILSIPCIFWENLSKLYVGVPPGELAPPPRGNPGSATVMVWLFSCLTSSIQLYYN